MSTDFGTRPLFAVAIARGGSTLLTSALNAHPSINLGKDPFLPLFRSLRDEIVRSSGRRREPDSPLDDYFFHSARHAVLPAIQSASLDIPVCQAERRRLHRALAERMTLTEPAFVPHVDTFTGRTYYDLFAAATTMVQTVRPKQAPAWVGFQENWPCEFLPALARAFPSAKFILIVRDIRASLASQARIADPLLQGLPFSFLRSWRKLVATIVRYRSWDLFAGRLHVVRYEDVARDAHAELGAICRFLDIPFDEAMTIPGRYVDTTGQRWSNNSSFDAPQERIFDDSVDRWRSTLPQEDVNLAQFVAGPELSYMGYPLTRDAGEAVSPEICATLSRQMTSRVGWRITHGPPEVELALESLRRQLLTGGSFDRDLVERAFLFAETYEALKDLSPTAATESTVAQVAAPSTRSERTSSCTSQIQ